MAFITVPEERFKTDVMKTRVEFLTSIKELAGVEVLTRRPDIDVWLKLPNIVLSRVWKEDWGLARLSGYHWEAVMKSPESPKVVWELRGYTMTAMYQFDIMTKTIWEMNKIASIIESYLKGTQGTGVFANDWAGLPQQTVIPLKDYADTANPKGSPTDLAIRFRPQRDVECLEIPAFDKELHQYTISVSFWIHYLKQYDFPRIESISENWEIETN